MKTPYQKVKEWRERNPQKRKAQMLVFSAVRNGTLRRGKCEVCGAIKTEAHHYDYSLFLVVEWLCKKHHMEADKNRRELTNNK